jgi:hypothetical protein
MINMDRDRSQYNNASIGGYAQACGNGANTGIITGGIAGGVSGMVMGGGGFVPGAIVCATTGAIAGCVQGIIDYGLDNHGRSGGDRYVLGLDSR